MSDLLGVYKKIVDNISDGLYFVDNGRRILFWNRAAELITGYTKEEVEGSYCWNNILSHIDEDGNELCMTGCPLEKTVLDGKERDVTIYLRHKDGYRIPVNVKAIPMFDKRGGITGAIEIFNSTSSYNKLETRYNIIKESGLAEVENGIFSKNSIEKKINSIINSSNEEKRTIAIAMFEFEHELAQELETVIIKTILNNLEENDVIGRWDKNKIVIIFNNNIGDKSKMVSRLKNLIRKTYINVESREKEITILEGIIKPESEDSPEILIERLEKLCSEAGKNSIIKYNL